MKTVKLATMPTYSPVVKAKQTQLLGHTVLLGAAKVLNERKGSNGKGKTGSAPRK